MPSQPHNLEKASEIHDLTIEIEESGNGSQNGPDREILPDRAPNEPDRKEAHDVLVRLIGMRSQKLNSLKAEEASKVREIASLPLGSPKRSSLRTALKMSREVMSDLEEEIAAGNHQLATLKQDMATGDRERTLAKRTVIQVDGAIVAAKIRLRLKEVQEDFGELKRLSTLDRQAKDSLRGPKRADDTFDPECLNSMNLHPSFEYFCAMNAAFESALQSVFKEADAATNELRRRDVASQPANSP